MNGFEKRAERIKAKILETTLELLRGTDPKKLRIADISKEASVSQVTIYNYFGSKEALYRQVFIRYTETAVRDFEAYMNEGHSFKEKIEHILLLKDESYRQMPPRVIQELLKDDPELAQYLDRMYREKTVPLTVRILQEGKESGDISENVSVESVLAFMNLYMSQYENLIAMAQHSGDMDRFFSGMVHLFFYGICGKE